jgi:hypothetical protein
MGVQTPLPGDVVSPPGGVHARKHEALLQDYRIYAAIACARENRLNHVLHCGIACGRASEVSDALAALDGFAPRSHRCRARCLAPPRPRTLSSSRSVWPCRPTARLRFRHRRTSQQAHRRVEPGIARDAPSDYRPARRTRSPQGLQCGGLFARDARGWTSTRRRCSTMRLRAGPTPWRRALECTGRRRVVVLALVSRCWHPRPSPRCPTSRYRPSGWRRIHRGESRTSRLLAPRRRRSLLSCAAVR